MISKSKIKNQKSKIIKSTLTLFKAFNQQPTTNNPQPTVGFSLIELLVSIAVIAMVMAVLFPNFMGFRERARDTQRKSDLSQIQKALEMYKLDQNPQAYPTSFAALSCGSCFSSGANCTGNIYMRKFPCDPGGTAPTYIYITVTGTPDSLKYSLSTCLENSGDANQDQLVNPACSATNVSYTISEP